MPTLHRMRALSPWPDGHIRIGELGGQRWRLQAGEGHSNLQARTRRRKASRGEVRNIFLAQQAVVDTIDLAQNEGQRVLQPLMSQRQQPGFRDLHPLGPSAGGQRFCDLASAHGFESRAAPEVFTKPVTQGILQAFKEEILYGEDQVRIASQRQLLEAVCDCLQGPTPSGQLRAWVDNDPQVCHTVLTSTSTNKSAIA